MYFSNFVIIFLLNKSANIFQLIFKGLNSKWFKENASNFIYWPLLFNSTSVLNDQTSDQRPLGCNQHDSILSVYSINPVVCDYTLVLHHHHSLVHTCTLAVFHYFSPPGWLTMYLLHHSTPVSALILGPVLSSFLALHLVR